MLLPWSEIETVLLDMDGTLLDLHFDNYFWLEYLPQCYSHEYKVSYVKAKELIDGKCKKIEGTLDWYCVDFWTQELGLPIMELKYSIAERIKWRTNAEFFLAQVNAMGKKIVLITNAHPSSLALKKTKVNLTPWFDRMISAHDYGFPKESQLLWKCLQHEIKFDPKKTLFIDDSLTVLNSAKCYDIKHLYTIFKPDSKKQPRSYFQGFEIIKDFADCFKFRK